MKNKLLSLHPLNIDLGILLLRIIFGCFFVYYGYQKLVSFNEYAPNFPDYIGVGATTSLILVIFAELICGFFVLIGFLTRLSIIPIFITMIVAYFMAHAQDPFTAKQLPFLYMLLCFVILFSGAEGSQLIK